MNSLMTRKISGSFVVFLTLVTVMRPLPRVYSDVIVQSGFAVETPRAQTTRMASVSGVGVDRRVFFQGIFSPAGKITFFTLPGFLFHMYRLYMRGQMSWPLETFITLIALKIPHVLVDSSLVSISAQSCGKFLLAELTFCFGERFVH